VFMYVCMYVCMYVWSIFFQGKCLSNNFSVLKKFTLHLSTSRDSRFILITAFFWAITQRVVVIPYRHFGTVYQSHSQGSRILDLGIKNLLGFFTHDDGTYTLSRNLS
jgi:hypothetical protein